MDQRAFSALAAMLIALGPACSPAGQQPAAREAPAKAAKASPAVARDAPQPGPEGGASAKEPKASQFLRIVKDKQGNPQAMETAIVRYEPMNCGQTGPAVDLVAAVHVGEKGYYQELNKAFKDYDVVLYELVAPEGTKVPKGGGEGGAHPVSALQKGMTQMLELRFQLEEIDYTPKHFVHADMSPEDLAERMKDRGESLMAMFLRAMGYAMAKQGSEPGRSPDADLLMALFDKDRALALKRLMAEQFQDMEGMMKALEGPDGSSLIAGRNQAALDVLKKQLGEGKKKIAVFYGAGHMADMEKRLRDDFGLVPIRTRWVKAWDLSGAKK